MERLAAVREKVLQLSRPRFVNGTWRRPILSGRKLAKIRKTVILSGRMWPELPRAGKTPGWMKQKRKENKGHRFEKEKIARYSKTL
jgi:hypothetical protein